MPSSLSVPGANQRIPTVPAPPLPVSLDFPRLQFPGFGSPGTCFLRVYINAGQRAVFLCAQLLDYRGTSITNAVEDILSEALRLLEARGVSLESAIPLQRRIRWIEHYPSGTGILPQGSYALVNFDKHFNPIWHYMPRDTIMQACGMEENFFHIDQKDLTFSPEVRPHVD